MRFRLREALETISHPHELYRHPNEVAKHRAHKYYELIGTYIVVVYTDDRVNGQIRTAYADSYPEMGVQGWVRLALQHVEKSVVKDRRLLA